MDGAAWLSLGTLITAIAGLSLVVWQLREQRRAMRAEFGNLYIQRYWALDDDLLLVDKRSEIHKRHRHRYLRLFEDEFDVASLGFLDKRQWTVWHAVLDDREAVTRIKDDLSTCDPSQQQFLRLRDCIEQRAREGRSHHVSQCQSA